MKGYLNADANAKFLALDGCYDTGDIVSVDTDGDLHILGRMSGYTPWKKSGPGSSLIAIHDGK